MSLAKFEIRSSAMWSTIVGQYLFLIDGVLMCCEQCRRKQIGNIVSCSRPGVCTRVYTLRQVYTGGTTQVRGDKSGHGKLIKSGETTQVRRDKSGHEKLIRSGRLVKSKGTKLRRELIKRVEREQSREPNLSLTRPMEQVCFKVAFVNEAQRLLYQTGSTTNHCLLIYKKKLSRRQGKNTKQYSIHCHSCKMCVFMFLNSTVTLRERKSF